MASAAEASPISCRVEIPRWGYRKIVLNRLNAHQMGVVQQLFEGYKVNYRSRKKKIIATISLFKRTALLDAIAMGFTLKDRSKINWGLWSAPCYFKFRLGPSYFQQLTLAENEHRKIC